MLLCKRFLFRSNTGTGIRESRAAGLHAVFRSHHEAFAYTQQFLKLTHVKTAYQGTDSDIRKLKSLEL